MKETWNLKEGVELCRQIEEICPQYGCHVALTGGTLYKDGERKDLDLLIYRIRQCESIDYSGLYAALEEKCTHADHKCASHMRGTQSFLL